MTDPMADEILALEQRRFKAMCAGDVAELDRLLHRDLNYTHSSGVADSKASYLGGVRDRRWDYQSIKTSGETVSRYGDTALVHCRLQIDLKVRDVEKKVDFARADRLGQGRRPLAGRRGPFDRTPEVGAPGSHLDPINAVALRCWRGQPRLLAELRHSGHQSALTVLRRNDPLQRG